MPRPSKQEMALREERLARTPRVEPPPEMSDEEMEVWHSVVSVEPADWFSPSTTPLLTQYCRHVVAAKRIAQLVEIVSGGKEIDSMEYIKLLDAQRKESASIMALATKMRLSQQSTKNHRGNGKRPISISKPWDDKG